MAHKLFSFLFLFFIVNFSLAQSNPLEKFATLIGNWEGTGEGFSASKSVLEAEYSWILNKRFIQVRHRSEFEPTEKNPDGEVHEDLGVISYKKDTKNVIFRQYHGEGFYNEYVLNDSLSTHKTFVFETTKIENFVPGGRARFTINIIADTEIETFFDVGFPGKEMSCFGKNQLKKVSTQ